MNDKRRTQAERTAATRGALVAAARRLFAEQGYADVGTSAIAAAAGVTRGALYHQFTDKEALFEAVFEDVDAELVQRLTDAALGAGATNAIAALEAGVDAWLDAATDPAFSRILLVDAPAVLGWARWRELGMKYGLGLTEALLTQAMAEGALPEQPVRPLAHLLVAAVEEAALYVERAEDPATARAEARAALLGMVRSGA